MSINMGTSVQLFARAPQDAYLTTPPDASFFAPEWKRHTPFAGETKEELFYTGFGFGMTPARASVSRSGDLLGDLTLQITLPIVRKASGGALVTNGEGLSVQQLVAAGRPADAAALVTANPTLVWNDSVGYLLLRRARLRIGETIVHDQERLWYHISDALFMPHGRKAALDAMIGRGSSLSVLREHTLFVPLKFLCCKDHREAQTFLPLAGLTSVPISVELELESFEKCVTPAVLAAGGVEPFDVPSTRLGLRAILLCDYVRLDTPEQTVFLRDEEQTLQFEQVQDMEAPAFVANSSGTMILPAVKVDLSELNIPTKLLVAVVYDTVTGTPFVFETDAVVSMYLEFNARERFEARSSEYFQLQQRYDYLGAAGRPARDGIHAYSFALDASRLQASGSVNFSALELPLLKATLNTDVVSAGTRFVVKVFSVSYNWLVCKQGAAQLKYV